MLPEFMKDVYKRQMKLGFRQVSTTTSAMKIRKMKYSLINPLIFFCFISLFSLYFDRGGQCHDAFLRERIALYLTGEITLAHYHDAVSYTHLSALSSFADVPADAYYAKAVAWAVENGITNGTTDTTFGPDEDVYKRQVYCTANRFVKFFFTVYTSFCQIKRRRG